MDFQGVATASLLVPALVFGVIAWRARRVGRTTFGIGIRGGGLAELGTGLAWGAVTAVVFLAVFAGTGIRLGQCEPRRDRAAGALSAVAGALVAFMWSQ